MDDIAEHIRWTTVVGIVIALTAILMVINAVAGKPLVTSTYAISAPIVLVLFLAGLAVLKRTR